MSHEAHHTAHRPHRLPPVLGRLDENALLAAARAVVEHGEEAFVVVDRDLRVRMACRQILEMVSGLGHRPEALIGRPLAEALPFLNPGAEAECRSVIETGRPVLTREVVSVGGVERHFRARRLPMEQGGEVTHVVTILTDLTEYTVDARRIAAQRRLAEDLLSVQSLDEALELCLSCASEVSGLEAGGVYLVDDETGDLRLACSTGLSETFVDAVSVVAPDDPRHRRVMAGTPHFLSDFAKDDPVALEGLAYVAALPVRHEGRVIACFNLASYTAVELSQAARDSLEAVVAQLGGIIARVRTQERERAAQAKLGAAFDSVSVGWAIIDGDDERRVTNRALQQMLGYSAEELATLPIEALTHPECFGEERRLYDEVRAGLRNGFRIEKRYVRKDGEIVWGDLTLNVVRRDDGRIAFVSAMVIDVTQRKQAEAEAARSAELLDAALAAGDMALWTRNLVDLSVAPSDRLARLLGLDPAQVVWTQGWLDDRVHPDDARASLRSYHDYVHGLAPAYSTEVRIRCGDDRYRWFRIQGRAIEWSDLGRPLVAAGTIQDIDDLREASERAQQLEIQNQKLDGLGLLAGGIAHDLGNILQGVLHNTTILERRWPDGESADQALASIRAAALRAAELSDQLMVYAGRRDVPTRQVDMTEVVRDVMAIVGSSVSKKATIRYMLQDNLPPVVGDPTQLHQVVMNLVINASDALMGGEGDLLVEASEIRLSRVDLEGAYIGTSAAPGPHVALTVSDTGCGMDAATRRSMFDPFFTTKRAGRGMGLAAVLGIVQRHRGAIRVDSAPGEGTTITILLPVADRDSRPVDAPQPPAEADVDPQGVTVLVVDDEYSIRESTRVLLANEGYHVLAAEDGAAAVDIVRESDSPIDIVFMDLRMPRMGGVEAGLAIHELRPEVPIVCVTALGEDDLAEEARRCRFTATLRKPYEIVDAVRCIRRVLNGTQRTGANR